MTFLRILIVLASFCIAATKLHAQNITITEINYKSDITLDAGDWLELYNFGTTTIDLSGWKLTDSGAVQQPFTFAAGTTIAPGGRLVVYRTISKFLSRFSAVSNKVGAFSFKLNTTDQIILSDASGVQVLSIYYSDNNGWPKGPDGEGRTLQLRNEASNTNLSQASSWRDACMEGSPGVAPPSDCNDPIIFSEINYNSDSSTDLGEYIELYNRTSSPINLAGYYLRDRWDSVMNTFVFPAGTVLPANGYIVVSNDSTAFKKYHVPQEGKFFANFDYNLNNGGELIRLYKPNNELLYSMHYNDSIPWTDSADGKGYTLEFKAYNLHCNEGSNWFAGCKGGSPFGPHTLPCKPLYPQAIVQHSNKFNFSVQPNPVLSTLQIIQQSNVDAQVYIYNTYGQIVKQQNINGSGNLDVSTLPGGVYTVTLRTSNAQGSTKFLKAQ